MKQESKYEIGTIKPFFDNKNKLKKKFPKHINRMNKFRDDIRESIHKNYEIPAIYNPERISLNSLRDTYKNRWKGLNIHTVEITQGIRYFYITNHQHGKKHYVFIDCGVHSEFYKNKRFGGSA